MRQDDEAMDVKRGEARSRHVAIIGTGQIGTFTARALVEAGFVVHGLDIKPDSSFFYRFGPPADKASLYTVDVCNAEHVVAVFNQLPPCSVVVFCAGLAGRRVVNDDDTRRVYLEGPTHVARAALQRGTRGFVLTSSLAVYSPNTDAANLAETHLLEPPTAYGKILCEAEARFRAATADRGIVLRCAGVYGPNRFGMGSHSSRFFERLLFGAAVGRDQVVQGSWGDNDDYIYVKDIGRAMAATARFFEQRDGRSDDDARVFNIATSRVSSLCDVRTALGEVFPECRFELAESGRAAVERPPLATELARRSLGFAARYDLRRGLLDYAAEVGLLPGPQETHDADA